MNSKNKGFFSGVAIIICIFIFCLVNSISILSAQKAPKSLDISSSIDVVKKIMLKELSNSLLLNTVLMYVL